MNNISKSISTSSKDSLRRKKWKEISGQDLDPLAQEKCIRQHVRNVERKQKSLSSQQKANQYIAVNATRNIKNSNNLRLEAMTNSSR